MPSAAAFEAHAEAALSPEELVPVERVDAVVAGDSLGLDLAEELDRLAPFGMGNPDVALLLRAAELSDPVAMGEGKHVRFTVKGGGARARAVAFGSPRLPVEPGSPADATFAPRAQRLERDRRAAARPALRAAVRPRAGGGARRAGRISRRGAGRARDAARRGRRRRPRRTDRDAGMPTRAGAGWPGRSGPWSPRASPCSSCAPTCRGACAGCVTASAASPSARGPRSSATPALADPFPHLAALDPPAHAHLDALLRAGVGWAHLAWGDPELRFAQQITEREYGLRAPLAALYRALRDRGGAEGEELEAVLRGEPSRPRSPALAGRLLRVLVELRLVSLDRDRLAVTVPAAERTALERSPAFRAYEQRREDALQFLSEQTARAA